MYSHADRIRAVELYLKLGRRVKATIRQLGYPTKNALRNWYREYEQHRDLRVRCVARAPKFSEAQRQTGELLIDTASGQGQKALLNQRFSFAGMMVCLIRFEKTTTE